MDTVIAKVTEVAYHLKNNPLLNEPQGADLPLTGKELQFDHMDMCYLALELMAFYHIQLNADELDDHKFNTVRSIAACISRKLS